MRASHVQFETRFSAPEWVLTRYPLSAKPDQRRDYIAWLRTEETAMYFNVIPEATD